MYFSDQFIICSHSFQFVHRLIAPVLSLVLTVSQFCCFLQPDLTDFCPSTVPFDISWYTNTLQMSAWWCWMCGNTPRCTKPATWLPAAFELKLWEAGVNKFLLDISPDLLWRYYDSLSHFCVDLEDVSHTCIRDMKPLSQRCSKPTHSDCGKLCCNETLGWIFLSLKIVSRPAPLVWWLLHDQVQDAQLQAKGNSLARNTFVQLPGHTVHHSNNVWDKNVDSRWPHRMAEKTYQKVTCVLNIHLETSLASLLHVDYDTFLLIPK